ncbi:uncharacterized protein LOC120122221 [Hibiscus syriacus]|uniref:uncharacterized protein LOC120122221 n=1 Tax=Hibiscus syriacus TaxID=106335 RepID=UPI001920B5BE|nr:uncharacterized protein LOC120122221 [Hibiscus syriacus]
MPKTKGAAAPKSDDLEIVSIGSLYKGPWEKKYWSSSRGKDRYPYPVGYQAVRAHNGSTYKTEIHEGTKGPLFMISCDGQSCSGQTPDIAWEKSQKMGGSHLKIWHGKRFSCKIDSVEFFGFKNPFVQRLLRELVANVNGTAERSLLSSSSCNDASKMENDNGSSTICTAPELLPYLARPQIRKKRSTRCGITKSKLADSPGLKRPRSMDLIYVTEGSNLVKRNQVKDEHEFPATHFASKDENDKIIEASGLRSKSVGKDVKNSPAKDSFPLKFLDFLGHHGENEAKSKFFSSQNAKLTRVANIANEELCRPQDTVLEGFSFPVKTDDNHGDSSVPTYSMGINDFNLCAPDTLDFEDDRTSVALGARDTTNSKEVELTAADVVISDGFMAESHQEEEIGTSNSNTGSEKSDFDSVGQEMTKLMMTVLLPQAVPLLKRSSKKKKEAFSPCKVLPHVVNSREDTIETNHLLALPSFAISPTEDASTEHDTQTHIQGLDHGLVVPNLEHLNSVILDSFEDGQGDHVASQPILFSKHMKVDRTSFNKDALHSNIQERLSINPKQETSVYCGELGGIQDSICHKEVNMALNKEHLKSDVTKCESVLGCVSPIIKAVSEDIQGVSVNLDGNCAEHLKSDVNKSEYVLGCVSPIIKALSEDIHGVSVNLDENSADTGKHALEKKPKKALNCAEVEDTDDINSRGIETPLKLLGKDSEAETRAPRTSSSHQTQNKVYTRRKVSKQAHSARNYTAPLSESIICRNSGDDYAPNKSVMTGASLVSKSCHSSDDKPCSRNILGNTPMLDEEKTTTNCNPEISNITPSLSNEVQKLTCVSKAKDASCLLDPSVSLERIFQENCHKERLEHRTIVENGCSASCQNQMTSFCDKNLTISMGVQGSSDVNDYRGVEHTSDLKGIFNPVGRYCLPLPILSVLLGTKGEEIHICVSCGLLADRDRTLFVYKVTTEEQRKGCPSFVGYTSVALPSSEIDVERRGLQFNPGGQCLVLLDSIKTPYCREGRRDCICPICLSGCPKENAVKIVRVNSGYVSLVAKVETIQSVQCILVCENDYLLAAGKSGRLHLWVMNSTWSAWTEEFIIPAGDFISCVVELKKIPKCVHLVIGHNGFGDFILCYADMKGCNDQIIAETKFWFSEHKDRTFLPLEGEDVAIWLLVSTTSDAQHEHLSSNCQANTTGWRLALLVKDTVILGSTIDPRAAAVGASLDHGIVGRDDGLVYMWELSTGTRLNVLHHFKGGSVSCIATDEEWRPNVVAVASGDGSYTRGTSLWWYLVANTPGASSLWVGFFWFYALGGLGWNYDLRCCNISFNCMPGGSFQVMSGQAPFYRLWLYRIGRDLFSINSRVGNCFFIGLLNINRMGGSLLPWRKNLLNLNVGLGEGVKRLNVLWLYGLVGCYPHQNTRLQRVGQSVVWSDGLHLAGLDQEMLQ